MKKRTKEQRMVADRSRGRLKRAGFSAVDLLLLAEDAIENTNKLIRRYLPKEMDFNAFSDRGSRYPVQDKPKVPWKLRFLGPKTVFFDFIS